MFKQVAIYQGGKVIDYQTLPVEKTGNSDYPYNVKHNGSWRPARYIDFSITLELPGKCTTAPRPRKSAATAKNNTSMADVSSIITYESWRAGKLGNGPRVKAPTGKGQEWATRLYCERQLQKAMYYSGLSGARKQLKAGCKRDRIDRRRRYDKGTAWMEFINIATAVINNYHPDYDGMYWEGAKEIIDDAYGDASYKNYLVSA